MGDVVRPAHRILWAAGYPVRAPARHTRARAYRIPSQRWWSSGCNGARMTRNCNIQMSRHTGGTASATMLQHFSCMREQSVAKRGSGMVQKAPKKATLSGIAFGLLTARRNRPGWFVGRAAPCDVHCASCAGRLASHGHTERTQHSRSSHLVRSHPHH